MAGATTVVGPVAPIAIGSITLSTASATSPGNAPRTGTRDGTREIPRGVFRGRSCVNRDEDDPSVFEFDHLADKKLDIARGLRDHSW
jgi:hypothetical protein